MWGVDVLPRPSFFEKKMVRNVFGASHITRNILSRRPLLPCVEVELCSDRLSMLRNLGF